MTDQLEQLRESIQRRELQSHGEWRRLSQVTPNARQAFAVYEEAANKAKIAANTAQMKAEHYRDDDTLYPEGRKRLIEEAFGKAREEVRAQLGRMQGALVLLKSELTHAAVPRLDPAREMPARDELRLLLDGSADPVSTMGELVQRDGELAAVAVSSYGESYLRARGVPDAKGAAASIRDIAAACAAQSGDPKRRAIGEARGALGTLEGAYACTRNMAETALQAAEEAGAGL